MVGEMREPETMRLTLNASETDHLVMATIHSATCGEALQRMILAFPSEIQNSIAAQLADCLAAVICQRLRYEPTLGIRLPECEILKPTHAVKNFIRRAEFHQIVREAIAAKVLKFHHISGKENPADILTKFLPSSIWWPLMKPILHWPEKDKDNPS
jgi:Tfp pilus assembly pilus retraction ATPase PilT